MQAPPANPTIDDLKAIVKFILQTSYDDGISDLTLERDGDGFTGKFVDRTDPKKVFEYEITRSGDGWEIVYEPVSGVEDFISAEFSECAVTPIWNPSPFDFEDLSEEVEHIEVASPKGQAAPSGIAPSENLGFAEFKIRVGTSVTWKWQSGIATGKVIKIYRNRITLSLGDSEVTRNGSEENPALLIKQENGAKALKLASEVKVSSADYVEEEDKDPADLYAEQAMEQAAPIFEGWLDQLENQLFTDASSLEEIRDRVENLYSELDSKEFAGLMQSLLLSGYGAGVYSVQQETADDEDEAEFAESIQIEEPELLAAIRRILAKYYTDGIDAIASAHVNEDDDVRGVFLDYINPRLTKRLAFAITDNDISYRLLNPRDLDNHDFSEGDSLDFAAPKQCKKGINCGGACISANKTCHKKTTPAQKQTKQAIVNRVKKSSATQTPVNPSGFPQTLDGLKEVKSLGGTTGAKLVKDPATGTQYVMKKGNSPDHIREESAADLAYEALGVNVPKHKLFETLDGPVKLAEYVEGKQLNQLSLVGKANAMANLRENFAADALLANWDVVGTGYDNIIVSKDGKAHRIDNGGSLRYRAQGSKVGKNFDAAPTELFSMRDHAVNGQSADVFGALAYKDVMEQTRTLVADKTKVLNSVADPDLKTTLSNRLKTMDWLTKNEAKLISSGASGAEVEAFHKQLVGDLKTGNIAKLPTQVQAISQFKNKADPLKNAPGIKTKFDKLTDTESGAFYQKVENRIGSDAKKWEQKLKDPAWQSANNAPPPPPPGHKELAAVQLYTGGTYDPINRYLRGQDSQNYYNLDQDELKAITHLSSSGLLQLPSYSKTVYRGTDLTPNILARYEAGKTVTEAAFISTSKDQSTAWGGDTHYIIHPKKQSSKSADVEPFSNHKSEAEVLYPPGTKFKVLKKIVNSPQQYGSQTYENLIVLREM